MTKQVMAFASVLLSLAMLTGCPPEQGQLVDVGGFSLFYNQQGAGDYTVLFENGLSDNSSVWAKVQPEIAKVANTVSYDRAGVGGSDRGPDPRHGLNIAEELHTMLQNAKIPGPYILCAHSEGGMFARLFANLYPEEVAGMVLIEARHEDQDKVEAMRLSAEQAIEIIDVGTLDVDVLGGVGSRGEFVNLQNTYEQLKANPDIPQVPLVVMRAKGQALKPSEQAAIDQIKLEFQEQMAALSANSSMVYVPDSGHDIQKQKPQAVINAIQSILDQLAASE